MSSDSHCSTLFPQVAVTGEMYMQCAREFGIGPANRLLAYGEKCVQVYSRVSSAYAASVRSSSSAGSTSSGSAAAAGLSGARLDAIRKVGNWRQNGDKGSDSVPVKKLVPNGLCYTKMLTRDKGRKESAIQSIGEWPTFGSLIRRSASDFMSVEELERFRVVPGPSGMAHVLAGGLRGDSMLDAVVSYASKITVQPGTLAAHVVAHGGNRSHVPWVNGKLRVGGVADDSFMSLHLKSNPGCTCSVGLARTSVGAVEAVARIVEQGVVSQLQVANYTESLSKLVDCKDQSCGILHSHGSLWDNAENLLYSVLDRTRTAQVTYSFVAVGGMPAVSFDKLEALRLIHSGWQERLHSSHVTYVHGGVGFPGIPARRSQLLRSVCEGYASITVDGLQTRIVMYKPQDAL